MKKIFVLGLTIMMAISTFMLQGCRDSEAQNTPDPSVPTIATYNVGWNSLSVGEKREIIDIGTTKQPGGVISMSPKMTEVISVTYLDGVPSPIDSCQTLVNYRYRGVSGTGTNQVLIKGHLDGIESLSSLPDLLNSNECCFKYGGCITAYECDQQLPKAKSCKPCKESTQPKPECQPCQQQGYTPGKKQGSGATKEVPANGGNRRIINL